MPTTDSRSKASRKGSTSQTRTHRVTDAIADAVSAETALPAPPPRELLEGPSRDDLIRRRAYDLYERNGRVDGRAMDDWLAAEAELGRMDVETDTPLEHTGAP